MIKKFKIDNGECPLLSAQEIYGKLNEIIDAINPPEEQAITQYKAELVKEIEKYRDSVRNSFWDFDDILKIIKS